MQQRSYSETIKQCVAFSSPQIGEGILRRPGKLIILFVCVESFLRGPSETEKFLVQMNGRLGASLCVSNQSHTHRRRSTQQPQEQDSLPLHFTYKLPLMC